MRWKGCVTCELASSGQACPGLDMLPRGGEICALPLPRPRPMAGEWGPSMGGPVGIRTVGVGTGVGLAGLDRETYV